MGWFDAESWGRGALSVCDEASLELKSLQPVDVRVAQLMPALRSNADTLCHSALRVHFMRCTRAFGVHSASLHPPRGQFACTVARESVLLQTELLPFSVESGLVDPEHARRLREIRQAVEKSANVRVLHFLE
jgi:hypothetical protein